MRFTVFVRYNHSREAWPTILTVVKLAMREVKFDARIFVFILAVLTEYLFGNLHAFY